MDMVSILRALTLKAFDKMLCISRLDYDTGAHLQELLEDVQVPGDLMENARHDVGGV